MKKLVIVLILTFVASSLVLGSSERPDLGGAKSNWTPPPPSPGLATQDLTTLTPNDIVDALVGSGPNAPIISNVTYTGAPIAAGTFSGGTGIIGFESGVILSSGNVASVVGPNVTDDITTDNGLPGDADLDSLIPGDTTYDATILEFDFECENIQTISFYYVFASDEYNEYVGTEFNDVFAFFVNGVDIAVVPLTTTPVSVNNVNCGDPYNPPLGGTNCSYYINNDLDDGGGAIDTEMDGMTVVLSATTAINPGVNHMKLAIADAGDHVLDSDIFLKGESFVCEVLPPPVIPTLTEWGIIVFSVLLVGWMAWVLVRRRRAADVRF